MIANSIIARSNAPDLCGTASKLQSVHQVLHQVHNGSKTSQALYFPASLVRITLSRAFLDLSWIELAKCADPIKARSKVRTGGLGRGRSLPDGLGADPGHDVVDPTCASLTTLLESDAC